MTFKKIFTVGLLASLFAACDNIDDDKRLIPITPDGGSTVEKNILIEDFTGMKCVNCPEAAAQIKMLQATYQGRIVPVAIHPKLEGFYGPLANDLATEYAEHYGVESLPKGMVDRQALQDYDRWATTAYERSIAKVPALDIELATDYSTITGELSVAVALQCPTPVDGKLQVWLVENGITQFQLMPNGSVNASYEHNHVLRAAVNGTWGEEVFVQNEKATKTYTITPDAEWKAENLAVVAFVYNDANGVVQVVEKELFESNEGGSEETAPEFALLWNDDVTSNIDIEAVDGVATLSNLKLVNQGTSEFTAQVQVKVLDNPVAAAVQFTVGQEAYNVTDEKALDLQKNVPASAALDLLGSVTFAETPGTVKVQITVTVGEVVKQMIVNFTQYPAAQPDELFYLINNGEVVVDGATIEVFSTSFEYAPGMGFVTSSTNNADNGQQLVVKNLTGEDLEATYTVEVIEQGAALGFQLCAFGDCLPLSGTTLSKSGTLVANSETATDWHAEFEYGKQGSAKTKFTVTVGEVSQTVYVNFNYYEEQEQPTGTFSIINNGEVVADGATIEVASTSFEYAPGMGFVTSSTNNADNGQQLMVKNLTGEDLEATYTVEVIEQGAALGFQLCAFGDCLPLSGTTLSKSGKLVANSETTTDWHAEFEYEKHGSAKTKFTVTVGDETQTIYVNFVY
ncbi:MAG: Omp28 family outer membrane lipoprotein [Bacteroidaceae bacterium]|nr:Omp28 family outer membrane lipoprotein [Bacteroidaceae bacterium]